MKRVIAVGVSLLLTMPALADDDAASGLPTGKRQHKPVSATQPQTEPEEAKGTRVRKTMQDLKNNAQEPEPAMNKADLIDRVAQPPSTQRMNKAELTEGLAKDANLSKADSKRAVDPGGSSERLRHKDRGVNDKTDKNEAARAKKKEKPPQ